MRAGRILCVLLVGLLFSPNLRGFAQDKSTEAAQRADEVWLGLVDSGKYAESYRAAAATFQAAVSEAKWVEAVEVARGPLGKLMTRSLKSARYTKTLPGAPDGEYVVLIYETSFEHKDAAVETVTAR
ncbi:MAG TPA: DUF4019 domain-containing protein, partial [Edaphobacter sp.]